MPSAAISNESAGSKCNVDAAIVAVTIAGTATLVNGSPTGSTNNNSTQTKSIGAKKAPVVKAALSPPSPANETAMTNAKLNKNVATTEYEYSIDAYKGTILEWDKETDHD